MPHTIYVGARSRFVTVTAWVFIVLGVLASVSAVVQNAHFASLVPSLQVANHASSLPWLAKLLMDYLSWLMGAALGMSLATLASAIGLLWRLDWARRTFIGVLTVAIIANLGGLWLQHELVHSLVAQTLTRAPMPAHVLDVFGGFVTAAQVMAVLFTLGGCLMLAWIIRFLMMPSVRQEFA
jgi:hypothetical protein